MTNNSTIKLFGRTIFQTYNTDVSTNDSSLQLEFGSPFLHEDSFDHSPYSSSCSPSEVNSPTEHDAKRYKETSCKELISVQEDEASFQSTEDSKSHTPSSLVENPKTPSSETETSKLNSHKIDEQSDMSQEKSPMKPDIIVPCPRCKSMDTKFCYYNNYNVKQPRHFCKNCQRYWTSGGATRNMIVGAGRRKNKLNAANGLHSTTILTFGSDSSAMSSTSLDKKVNVGSHEETFDKSYQSLPPQFSWNPAMCYPVSFYPNIAYYGGCLVPSWNVQSISTQSCGQNSTTLGKHSRDGNILLHSNSEKENLGSERNNNSVFIPKTLRIDDPNEIANSSIWSTLGIKNGGELFMGFASKGGVKNHVETSSSVLQANPVALSRSLVFHERV